MGKAWKRFNHRRRTWGAKQEAPPPPAPKAKVAEPATPIVEPKTITEEAVSTAPAPKTKTKRPTRKTSSTKKK